MNKHHARDVALEVLIRVERNQSYSHIELNRVLQDVELSQADVGLVTAIVYGTLQRQNTLDWILAPFLRKKLRKRDRWVRELLRMSVYQLTYLQKVPPAAAVHESVEIAKRRGHRGIASFVNAVLRNVLRHKDEPLLRGDKDPVKKLALEHSHPEWLVKRWLAEWDKDKVVGFLAANNAPPAHTIRINPLKTSRLKLKKMLETVNPKATVRLSDIAELGLIVEGFGNIGDSEWFHKGECSIQDESSMLVGQVLRPSPGASVLDMCAAPGGKATHLAELMHGDGLVEAYDIHSHRVKLIAQQAQRLGLPRLVAKRADARQLPQLVSQLYDYVLLDAPCSGFGVIRRKPEIKWRQSMETIKNLVTLQRQLLDAAAKLVKPGGVLVYSTCTLEPRENEQQIAMFLDRYPAFFLDENMDQHLPKPVIQKAMFEPGMLRIFPQDFNSDGFFIARLLRGE